MQSSSDLENQYDKVSLDLDGPNDPLLPRSGRSSARVCAPLRRSLEVIELDDIPPIIKSNNGNVFWADERCGRRVGLTATEARLFLKLLQTDEPENYNYDEFKSMFDDFGREQKRLEDLVHAVKWWNVPMYRQRSIWNARIQWLKRMDEPRLWLLYLMARRRRILKKATKKVLCRLKEKRRVRMALHESPTRGRQTQPTTQQNQPPDQRIMINDETQTSELQLDIPTPPIKKGPRASFASEASQTSDVKLGVIRRIRDSLSESRHQDSSHSHNSHHSGSRPRHSRSSHGHCPVFEDRIEATREHIKKQVEIIMPPQKPYIVIGWFVHSASDPNERIMQFDNPEELFKSMRKGERNVRGYRRFLSLRGLRGFGLYKCDISRGAHIPLILNASQEAVLSQMYLAYNASYRHHDEDVARAWQGWVYKNLNDCKNNPLEGRYSLQLIYDWSSYRLSTVVAIPLLLSLAIGFWYMNGRGDVVTAWTLALYIVTAAAALIALMAVIGGLKDI
ncbi:uncharacterized protein LY89DRAFT_583188 [Mollisia scopiformis]|uniref:Uncharacterized protein n=1 Tax=Mollisia scopiformis TaxID=149040 RepID=A0A194XER9_MOLSC|nr:uncharacterized protein LY89DRAFT_583188 [Mollisia scopiformis]KUJ18252.1 hypothetical protein LY89DRAFT_583188 [Mollisia scopiformis]